MTAKARLQHLIGYQSISMPSTSFVCHMCSLSRQWTKQVYIHEAPSQDICEWWGWMKEIIIQCVRRRCSEISFSSLLPGDYFISNGLNKSPLDLDKGIHMFMVLWNFSHYWSNTKPKNRWDPLQHCRSIIMRISFKLSTPQWGSCSVNLWTLVTGCP